jgi:hypothetical protein
MCILIALLVSGSVFSVDGIGQDLSTFRTPFLETQGIGQIAFTLNPEYTLLNEGGDFRGIFWTNPLQLSISVPVISGFTVLAGNLERFDQSYDIYLQDSTLRIHGLGEGAIEEVYAGVNKNLGPVDIVATGSYLFGTAWEIWRYSISGYAIVDTFLYHYRGRMFNFGLRHKVFSVAYEGFGEVRMTKLEEDTITIDLPQRVSIGIYPKLGKWPLGIVYEHSLWDDTAYNSPHRFRVSARRGVFGVACYVDPWYTKDVTEYGLDISYAVPLRNVGSAKLNMAFTLRQKDGLREFQFAPKLTFVLSELFIRRRK